MRIVLCHGVIDATKMRMWNPHPARVENWGLLAPHSSSDYPIHPIWNQMMQPTLFQPCRDVLQTTTAAIKGKMVNTRLQNGKNRHNTVHQPAKQLQQYKTACIDITAHLFRQLHNHTQI